MKEKRILVVGAGHMGGAILAGLVRSGLVPADRVTAADPDEALRSRHREELGVRTVREAAPALEEGMVLVLAVKPQVWRSVVAPLSEGLGTSHLLVSVMAGVPTSAIEEALRQPVPVVRVMPNLLAGIGASASALCAGANAGEEEVAVAEAILRSVGETVVVDEGQMDAVTGLSGSGPAFLFVMIDALADGGVEAGLPRPVALRLAAQTAFGAARMVLESGDSPSVLKERVTSPGGTTIAGLAALEQGGLRTAAMAAVRAAAERSRELGQT